MRRVIRQGASALAVMVGIVVCAQIASADVKIKLKTGQGNTTSEQTTYIKGQRQRMEMANGLMISITQCDLQRSLQINPQTRTYIVTPFNQTTEGAKPQANQPPNQPRTKPAAGARGGLVTTVITSRDTGERKQIFGFAARHYIMTISTSSSPDACQQVKSKMEIDAWYIDAGGGLDCNMSNAYQNYNGGGQNGCQDRYDVKQVGPAAKGYAVWTRTTMFDESGKATFSYEQEALEISQAPLDAALFDVPPGYREVKDFSQAAYGSADSLTANRASHGDDVNAGVKTMAGQPSESGREAGTKRAGVIRFGLPLVKIAGVDERINAADLAAAIRNTLAGDLNKPNVEVLLIESAVPAQIDAEAKRQACDFVIYANAEHKKGGGRFGAALSSVASAAGYGVGSTGSAGRHGSANATAADVSGNIKAKDQLTLDLNVQRPNAAPMFTQQFKAKAQSNGEDIISPTIGQAAQAVLDATKK